jgi:hypothetical protein
MRAVEWIYSFNVLTPYPERAIQAVFGPRELDGVLESMVFSARWLQVLSWPPNQNHMRFFLHSRDGQMLNWNRKTARCLQLPAQLVLQ